MKGEIKLDFLNNKTVLVTGGTGSFGKSFSKFLLEKTKIKKLIVFSRDELKQFQMDNEIKDDRIRFFIGDIRDLQRLQRAFRDVDIVVHAAALKQVPTLEYNPFEAVKTNILGTQNVIDAAIDQGVEKILLISTDKAAQPVNLYGATKLCAEKLVINGNVYAKDGAKFSCVRYGNVIGSRGSIVETLIKNKNTKTVNITDKDMTRFWLALDKAFDLVLYALKNMEGGEIFIPKVPTMKLTDLFDALAPNAKKNVVGIRPGEKVHEMLLTSDESRHALDIGDYFVILPEDEYIHNVNKMKKFTKIGKPLVKGFSFTSDNNKVCMTSEELLEIAEKMFSL